MILLDKTFTETEDFKVAAGDKQESNVAFFLRRAFKEHPEVMIFNDFKFSHNGENAQIDHLIVYPYGFILVESKSITGEVKVNKHQEWSRSYLGKWKGIPSPMKQVELQKSLLMALLATHKTSILGRIFLKQQSFGRRCWDCVCAISSSAIIDREHISKNINDRLVKSEFLVEKLTKLMHLKSPISRTLSFFDTRPAFNSEEIDSICQFLLKQNNNKSNEQNNDTGIDNQQQSEPEGKVQEPNYISLVCKHCHKFESLIPKWGQYGYYVKCGDCNGNTSMKQPCPSCSDKKTKVSKHGDQYTLICEACGASTPFKQLSTNAEVS